MKRPVVTIVYNSCIHVVKSRLTLVAALREVGYDVAVIAPADHASPRLKELGIPHYPIPMTQYGMNPLAELRAMRAIERRLRKLAPVATLNYTIKPNIFGSLAAHRVGVPVVANVAGAGRAFTDRNAALKWVVRTLYRRALGPSRAVFFQNGDDMRLFSGHGLVREEQCVRIPGSGVDLDRFRATPLPQGPTRFLFVGRLLREKGIIEFLEAANALLAESDDPDGIAIDIVGEHEPEDGYVDRAELDRLTAAPQITYHGAVPPEAIDDHMRAATCVVLPSYYGEGVPRVLLEGCATGRPIITTDSVGCREVVEPGVNGWKVPPRDPMALRDAMRECAALPREALVTLARNARRTAEDRFDERIVIAAYLGFLERVAEADAQAASA